jgi:hypothetical protein
MIPKPLKLPLFSRIKHRNRNNHSPNNHSCNNRFQCLHQSLSAASTASKMRAIVFSTTRSAGPSSTTPASQDARSVQQTIMYADRAATPKKRI